MAKRATIITLCSQRVLPEREGKGNMLDSSLSILGDDAGVFGDGVAD